MAGYETEIITLGGVGDRTSFDALRRGYQLIAETPRPGETTFRTLGEYAVYQTNEVGQFLPSSHPHHPEHWEGAEVLRTRAGEGTFRPDHMDALEEALVRDHNLTNASNEIVIASERELHRVLGEYAIATDQWEESDFSDLYDDLNHPLGSTAENVTLHSVEGKLWLATAQTMLNIYYTDKDGVTWKLRETWKTRYDRDGKPQPPIKSTIRSSIGETGHLVKGRPERPFDTARRGLREELGIEDDNDILRIVSTGSLLRLKERGHHRFGPIKAKDNTHYFKVSLNHRAVRPKYINEERDAGQRLRTRIELEWATEAQ